MNAFRFYDLNDLGLISKEDFTKVFWENWFKWDDSKLFIFCF